MEALAHKRKKGILIAAHRGTSGGNIPCNTTAAFTAALMEKADIIELDVAVSRDGELFVFHPGMEHAHVRKVRMISGRSAASVAKLRFVNQDDAKTSYGVEKLEDVLSFLKGKCYINIDKFWTAPEKITQTVRRCGVEEQVIIKANSMDDFKNVEKFAPDLPFMPVIGDKDEVTQKIAQMNINLIGAEVLFREDTAPVCSPEYIASMHERGLMRWGNSIVYNERANIAAGHTDDCALRGNPENGWGWYVDRGFDIIQTDWAGICRSWLNENKQQG